MFRLIKAGVGAYYSETLQNRQDFADGALGSAFEQSEQAAVLIGNAQLVHANLLLEAFFPSFHRYDVAKLGSLQIVHRHGEADALAAVTTAGKRKSGIGGGSRNPAVQDTIVIEHVEAQREMLLAIPRLHFVELQPQQFAESVMMEHEFFAGFGPTVGVGRSLAHAEARYVRLRLDLRCMALKGLLTVLFVLEHSRLGWPRPK